jgi:hypothetical protein
VGRQNVAAVRRSVRHANDDMCMHCGRTVRHRDIADQRQDFHLFFNWDFFIVFSLPVEITESDIAKSANSGKMTAA